MAKTNAKLKTNIFIATPMFGGMCYGTYADSLANSIYVFMNAKIPLTYSFRHNEALITKGRDDLASEFMQTDCSHLMFIDADIGFDAKDILSMVDADKDVICGLYPRKGIDWDQVAQAARDDVPTQELPKHSGSFPINALNGKNITEAMDSSGQQPVEVRNAGTGFMLIKREVLESLVDKVPQYFAVVDGLVTSKVRKQYFDTSIDPADNVLLSEDFHFCKLVRDNGFKVWVAPWVVSSHTGTYTFTGRPYASA
jgi:hypothetical protein